MRSDYVIGGINHKGTVSDNYGFRDKDILDRSHTKVVLCNIPDNANVQIAFTSCIIFQGKIGTNVKFIDLGFGSFGRNGKCTMQFLKPLGKNSSIYPEGDSYFVFAVLPDETILKKMNQDGKPNTYHVMSAPEKDTIERKIKQWKEDKKNSEKLRAKREKERLAAEKIKAENDRIEKEKLNKEQEKFDKEKQVWERNYNANLAAQGYNMSLPFPVPPREEAPRAEAPRAAVPPPLPPKPSIVASDSPLLRHRAATAKPSAPPLPNGVEIIDPKYVANDDPYFQSPNRPKV